MIVRFDRSFSVLPAIPARSLLALRQILEQTMLLPHLAVKTAWGDRSSHRPIFLSGS